MIGLRFKDDQRCESHESGRRARTENTKSDLDVGKKPKGFIQKPVIRILIQFCGFIAFDGRVSYEKPLEVVSLRCPETRDFNSIAKSN